MTCTIINGIRLHYQLQGQGEPLVLIHGAQGDASSFDAIVDDLSRHYCVLRFDQRGSGLSDKPDEPYTIEIFAEDTIALLDHLCWDRAHFFGISLGGMITQACAIHNPSRVHTAVMGCTLPAGWEHAIKLTPSEYALIAYSTDEAIPARQRVNALSQLAFAPGFVDQHPEIIDAMIQARESKPIDQAALQRRLATTATFNGFEQLATIQCPVLVISGRQDQLVDCQNSQVIADQIPQAEIVLLDNAGHLFWVEHKQKTLTNLLNFLHQHPMP